MFCMHLHMPSLVGPKRSKTHLNDDCRHYDNDNVNIFLCICYSLIRNVQCSFTLGVCVYVVCTIVRVQSGPLATKTILRWSQLNALPTFIIFPIVILFLLIIFAHTHENINKTSNKTLCRIYMWNYHYLSIERAFNIRVKINLQICTR